MIRLKLLRNNSTVMQVASIDVPRDDYKLHALLRKGPVVSTVNSPLIVQVHDAAVVHEKHLVFPMSLVDASVVASEHPEFEAGGLLGSWKLVCKADGTFSLKLVEAFDAKDQQSVIGFLCSSTSAPFVADRYGLMLNELT